jgi:hypothetical protein
MNTTMHVCGKRCEEQKKIDKYDTVESDKISQILSLTEEMEAGDLLSL